MPSKPGKIFSIFENIIYCYLDAESGTLIIDTEKSLSMEQNN